MQTVPSGSSVEPGVARGQPGGRQEGRKEADKSKYKLEARLCVTISSLEATGNMAYRKGTEQQTEVPFTSPGTWQELWVCEPAEHGSLHALMPCIYLQNIKHRTDVSLLLQIACSVS